MNDQSVVDQAALAKLQAIGGDKLVGQMVKLYLENAAERLRQIDGGLAPAGSLDEAEAGAHSLKSSAANVGATRVNALAAAMEKAAMKGERAAVQDLRGALGDALQEAQTRLEELTKGFEA